MLFPVSVEVDEKAGGGGGFTTQRILILIGERPRKSPWLIKMRCGIMAISGEVRRSLRVAGYWPVYCPMLDHEERTFRPLSMHPSLGRIPTDRGYHVAIDFS
jgi:hypothetical protein